jgi:uncharacterized protein involved in exopolysaccharide biosynthesis
MRMGFGTSGERREIDAHEIDFGAVGAALNRNKHLIALATFGAAAAALMFCALAEPRFIAESRIIVETPDSGARGADAPQALDAEAVNGQIHLLTSRDLARKAMQTLELQDNPEFDPAARGSGLLAPLVWLGLLPDPSRQTVEDRVLANFFDHLTVMSPAGTRVLHIAFSSRDPDLSARGANTVADLTIGLQAQAKSERAHQAAQNLKPPIAALEARVAEADARVENFRAEKRLSENGETSVQSQQPGGIAASVGEARTAQSDAEAKASGLRDLLRQGRLADAGDFSTNDLVRRVSEQRALARSKLAVESRTLLPAHPRIKELQAQLSEIETQLRAAVEKAARGLDEDARVAGARVANLTAQMEEQKRAAAVSSADLAQLRALQGDARTLHDQLASETAKLQAALASADATPPDARIISRAVSPSQPVFPKTNSITLFAALVGLLCSAGAVAMRAMNAPRAPSRRAPPPPREIFNLAAVEPPVPAPAPAVAPDAQQNAPPSFALVEEEQTSPLLARVNASRRLIERIAATSRRGGAHVVIASAGDSAPACASLTLARSLSRQGRAILLQTDDEDLFLREALEVAAGGACDATHPGLSHLLSGEASFADAIFRDDDSRLHIVQAGGPVDAHSSDLSLILDALHATYDFVVIAAGADAAAHTLAAESDLTLIFANDRRSRDVLHDDFEASGVRAIVLAGLDRSGEIVEIAA